MRNTRISRKSRTHLHNSSFQTRLWTFFNSAFGLWFLSAIFISGVGATFTTYEKRRADDSTRTQIVERLDREIAYRFSMILTRSARLFYVQSTIVHNQELHAIPFAMNRDLKYDLELFHSEFPRVGNPSDWLMHSGSHYASLYPEYSNLSIAGLVTELERFETSDPSRQQLDHVLVALTSSKNQRDPTQLWEFGGDLLQNIILPRWKVVPFDFLHCPPAAPFCDDALLQAFPVKNPLQVEQRFVGYSGLSQ